MYLSQLFKISFDPSSSSKPLPVFAQAPFLLADIGFEIPDEFVVGYALDYNEYFRDLIVGGVCVCVCVCVGF